MLFEQITVILDAEPHAGALNMAVDEVLLQGAERPLLRVYGWAGAAVSFGYFGRAAVVAAQWPERELVRRWTGGGTVEHGEDFTYTLVVPRGEAFSSYPARESYRRIHAEIARLLGGSVSVLGTAWTKSSDECFANAAQFDLLAKGRKVAGAGQRRTAAGLLHQGSIQRTALPADFGQRLARGLAEKVVCRDLTAAEMAEATDLVAKKYGRAEWTGKY